MEKKGELQGKAFDTRNRLFQWLGLGEDAIYLVTGGLLAATAIVLLVSTALLFIEAIQGGELRVHAIEILDTLLLVLMLVEILYTIRLSIREHVLATEPFLVVALIAAIRRMLILTAEASQFIQSDPGSFRNAMLEMGLLTAAILVVVICIAILRQQAAKQKGS